MNCSKCGDVGIAKNLCKKHYQELHKDKLNAHKRKVRREARLKFLRDNPLPTDKERFEAKIKKTNDGCWEWTGVLNGSGYGSFGFQKRNMTAHRASYTLYRGEVPDEMEIDHLCRNRICMNPDHLEIVSRLENVRRSMSPSGINHRKTHCKNGHEFNEKNTRVSKEGYRTCRPCFNELMREWRKRNPDYYKK